MFKSGCALVIRFLLGGAKTGCSVVPGYIANASPSCDFFLPSIDIVYTYPKAL